MMFLKELYEKKIRLLKGKCCELLQRKNKDRNNKKFELHIPIKPKLVIVFFK